MENKLITKHEIAKKYDLVIIGGGPATISFISYLFRNKFNDRVFPYTSILIIEKSESFGSGCLGKYGINTNTSAEGFVRLICTPDENTKKGGLALSPNSKPMKNSKNYDKKSEKKEISTIINTNVINEMNGINEFTIEKGDKKQSYKPLNQFFDFFQLSPTQTLLKIGNRPAPLSLVGYYLDCFGNYLLNYIAKNYKKNIFLQKSEVTMIKVNKNDEFSITFNQYNIHHNIKAKTVILATGGRQTTSNRSSNEIVKIIGESNLFFSDYVLQEQGYKLFYSNLIKRRKKRVIIIGGSHSGFSCAWIIINKPVTYKNIYINDPQIQYITKFNKNCENCSQNNCCFGKIIDKNWDLPENDDHNNSFQNDIEVLILYRDHIKVHYPSEKDALDDNYTIYEKKDAVNKNGNVYPFIGLRGDAKELYRNIIKGNENRVKLVKAESWEEQKKIISQEDCAVIWACGYETLNIPVTDNKGNLIELNCVDDGGMYEVDKELRILDKNKNYIKNFYGVGQGYATFSIESVGGKKARADAVNLYNTYISKKLHKSLMGLFSKMYVEHNEKKRKNEDSLTQKDFNVSNKILNLEINNKIKIKNNDVKGQRTILAENSNKISAFNTISSTKNKLINENISSINENNNKNAKISTKYVLFNQNKENKIEHQIESENFEKNKFNNYGLTDRKFEMKIKFLNSNTINNTKYVSSQKFTLQNQINERKKFSFKDKK